MGEFDDAVTDDDPADAVLLDTVRQGGREAFGELWRRHSHAGMAFARYVSSTFDPDDLVAEAFTRILRALTGGGGPVGGFRSYLYATIRNTAHSWQRAHHYTQPLDETHDTLPDQRAADALEALEGSRGLDAYRSLPLPWQQVLWYVDIQGMSATEVAPLLGITPNAVAARSYRAREGLRRAWGPPPPGAAPKRAVSLPA